MGDINNKSFLILIRFLHWRILREGIGRYTDVLKEYNEDGNDALKQELNRNESIAKTLEEQKGDAIERNNHVQLFLCTSVIKVLKSSVKYLLDEALKERDAFLKKSPPQLALERYNKKIKDIEDTFNILNSGKLKDIHFEPIMGGAQEKYAKESITPMDDEKIKTVLLNLAKEKYFSNTVQFVQWKDMKNAGISDLSEGSVKDINRIILLLEVDDFIEIGGKVDDGTCTFFKITKKGINFLNGAENKAEVLNGGMTNNYIIERNYGVVGSQNRNNVVKNISESKIINHAPKKEENKPLWKDLTVQIIAGFVVGIIIIFITYLFRK